MRFKRLLAQICVVLPLLTGCHNEPDSELKSKLQYPASVAFSPDAKKLAVGYTDGVIILWDAKTWSKLKTVQQHDDEVSDMAFSANGAALASDSLNRVAKVWKWNTSQPPLTIKHDSLHPSISLSPDGKMVALIDDYRVIKLINTTTGKTITEFNRDGDISMDAFSVDFSPDGKSVAAGMKTNVTLVWRLDSPKHPMVLKGDDSPASAFSVFSPNGKLLATGGANGTVEIWNPATGKRKYDLLSNNSMHSAAFSPNNDRVAASSLNCKLWDTTDGTSMRVIIGKFNGTQAFSPDGKYFANFQDSQVYLYNPKTWNITRKLDR